VSVLTRKKVPMKTLWRPDIDGGRAQARAGNREKHQRKYLTESRKIAEEEICGVEGEPAPRVSKGPRQKFEAWPSSRGGKERGPAHALRTVERKQAEPEGEIQHGRDQKIHPIHDPLRRKCEETQGRSKNNWKHIEVCEKWGFHNK